MEWIANVNNWLGVSGTFSLMVTIILLSYLLEDLAIITAALLAADNALPAEYALIAIFIGIASGDAALYGAGMIASKWRALRLKLLTNKQMRYVRKKLLTRPFINIAIIRFIPGLRTLGFTLSGLFKVNFVYFLFSVLVATAVWTVIIFFCIYQLGSVSWLQDSQWKWVIAPVALVLLWLLNRTTARTSISKRANNRQGVSA
ncbi:VTT domain-containing protein [Vibrio hannami]|uniref:DedA family protein n=1 Tax=Vibrio hannami TaxID=2717094 RepID=UPI00240F48AA|nr:VTT domain-containing protein [Vibrio hannami]MDG3085940.1 VTT domain-containing protein [Vibrio hannami]